MAADENGNGRLDQAGPRDVGFKPETLNHKESSTMYLHKNPLKRKDGHPYIALRRKDISILLSRFCFCASNTRVRKPQTV